MKCAALAVVVAAAVSSNVAAEAPPQRPRPWRGASAGAGSAERDAGILYEIWHTGAAHLMHLDAAASGSQLTVEKVIRSDGNLTLNDVFAAGGVPPGFNPDIYNTEPELGFYCFYRPGPGENVSAATPRCPNITAVATQHAAWLTGAGFDYVAVDISNWPVTGWINQSTTVLNNEMTILRPLQVLAEEWLALRAKGIPTPSIAAWPTAACGPSNTAGPVCLGTKADGPQYAMWRWILDEFYNDPQYADIVYRVEVDGPGGAEQKKLLFLPSPVVPAYGNASFVAMLEDNGGRADVLVQSMWAMDNDFDGGAWGFFSSCQAPCPTPAPVPTSGLSCPAGEHVDVVDAPGDNGSCDCRTFCASDWGGTVKKARPHWTGATSAGAPGRATTQCQCVQATHWCARAGAPGGCDDSCNAAGQPTPANYCVRDAPAPAPGGGGGGGKQCVTTSMVGTGVPCNQRTSAQVGNASASDFEVSASGAYMASQCALPFASPGHLRGLTLQRLFAKVLADQPPHVFVSSFNEFIGGRQPAAVGANTARNMGLPYDPQNGSVWVDTYGTEFSRDIEPSAEGGGRVFQVAASCVRMYKAGRRCSDANASATEPCCTTADKLVFANAWSLRGPGAAADAVVATDAADAAQWRARGYVEVCNPVPGPTVFCVDTSIADGRNGPFMLYNTTVPDVTTRGLFRCAAASGAHFLSTDAACEGLGSAAAVPLGHVATRRGGEMLRALRRCAATTALAATTFTHALDLKCDDGAAATLLGFVR